MGERETAILVTLVAYQLILLGIGLLAQRRTRDEADFLLGGRALGPVVAAISASASSSSAWTLLGVSGYAFTFGLSALWLFPACVGGFVLNWYLVAPRLRRAASQSEALTLTSWLAGPPGQPLRGAFTAVASGIVLFSFLVYVAYQFQAAGKTFAETFSMNPTIAVVLGAAIIVAYTLLGGFWAASLTDTVQGLVMAATAMLLPALAVMHIGGPGALMDGIARVPIDGYSSVTQGFAGAAGVGLIAGLLGIGLGYPGQPHVVNRFMALRDEQAMVVARRVALGWAVVIYSGMILLGLCGRVLFPETTDGEKILLVIADRLCHPVVAGVVVAAILSAVMSTADSQLLVAGASISHDLGAAGHGRRALARSRLVVLALSAGAVAAALLGSKEIFSPVLFAWSAMGAAFGPLLLLGLWRRPPTPRAALASMVTGFTLSVVAYSMPLSAVAKGLERILPFVAATAVALLADRQPRR